LARVFLNINIDISIGNHMDIIGISFGDMDMDVGHVFLILIILHILIFMMDLFMAMME